MEAEKLFYFTVWVFCPPTIILLTVKILMGKYYGASLSFKNYLLKKYLHKSFPATNLHVGICCLFLASAILLKFVCIEETSVKR